MYNCFTYLFWDWRVGWTWLSSSTFFKKKNETRFFNWHADVFITALARHKLIWLQFYTYIYHWLINLNNNRFLFIIIIKTKTNYYHNEVFFSIKALTPLALYRRAPSFAFPLLSIFAIALRTWASDVDRIVLKRFDWCVRVCVCMCVSRTVAVVVEEEEKIIPVLPILPFSFCVQEILQFLKLHL